MKVLRNLLVLSIIAILFTAMVPVTSAYAAAPVIINTLRDETMLIENPCGFEIVDHEYGMIRWMFFFDNAGGLTRLDGHLYSTDMTWSANGKSLAVHMDGALHMTVLSDTQYISSETGMGLLITVPGYGKVYGKVGHQISLWEFGAPNTMIEVVKEVGSPSIPNWAVICDYLD